MGAGSNFLIANEVLQHNQFIRSSNGLYRLIYQGDGNLVLYQAQANGAQHPIWASNTHGRASQRCIMQGDGNLVIYNGNSAVWASGTHGNNNSRLVMQDDGNAVIYRSNNTAAWATNTVRTPSGPPASGDRAQPGQSLPIDQPLRSASGRYDFVFQSDGNLVLYKNYSRFPRRPIWASNTHGRGGRVCLMQGDGNLVIYDHNGRALWSSNTHNNPGSRLIVQDDGNTVIYRSNNTASWATNTVQRQVPTGPAAGGDRANPGQILAVDRPIVSQNGRYSFVFQGDGNLVLYKLVNSRSLPLWASNTNGRRAEVCIMQGDGNLVIYDPDGAPIWSSNTHGRPGAFLIMQNDGNAVIYTGSTPHWATNTNGMIVHFKSTLPLTTALRTYLTDQFNAMDELFAEGRINCEIATFEDLSGNAGMAALQDLDVGACNRGVTTAEQNTLFANRNNAGARDVVVYLCRSLIGGAGNFAGCAAHPAGRPACVIVQSTARWLLAHEIGHVLSLRHVDDSVPANSRFLMWPNTGWTSPPPDLAAEEYTAMRQSDLTPVP